MTVIYLVGSLRNPAILDVAQELESKLDEVEVYCDWLYAGKYADDWWQAYTDKRGLSYKQALESRHARNVFNFDKDNLDRADMGVLVMPAGKSGHMELGYLAGKGKPIFILMDKDPERFDIMPGGFAGPENVVDTVDALAERLKRHYFVPYAKTPRTVWFDSGLCVLCNAVLTDMEVADDSQLCNDCEPRLGDLP